MGRDVTGLRIDKKPNAKPNGATRDRVHAAPKILNNKAEQEEKVVGDHDANEAVNEGSHVKQDVLTVKGTNTKAGSPEGKNDSRKYHDEEDTCSLASSIATSVRSARSKVTVPVGPTFKSAERLARRKEYYTKLEEKHKALEAEKLEYVARSKEEEESVIKQLRKTMTYKANPVPNFYREGPPPKVELKKFPVTRAKSPNFTRRKSCGDVVKPSPDEKKSVARPTRHSIGVHKNGIASPTTPKSRELPTTRNVKGPTKLKDANGSIKTKARPKQVKETDIPVVVDTITSLVSERSPDPAVEVEMKNAETVIVEDVNMNFQKAIEA